MLVGLVAARAIAPASKLAAAWLTRRTRITDLTDVPPDGVDGELPGVSDEECYQAMDWLIHAAPGVEREVFWSLASLLDLEVALLFFDTTATCFQIDNADAPAAEDDRGHRLSDRPPQSTERAIADADGKPRPSADADGEQPARAGFRTWGNSKDHREDLPQIVIGMAVTGTGIPVRV